MALIWTMKQDGVNDVMADDVNDLAKAIMESDANIGQLNIHIENLNQQTSGNSQDIQNIVAEQNQINENVDNRLNELEQGGGSSVDLSDYYNKNETNERLEKKVDKIDGWGLVSDVSITTDKNKIEKVLIAFHLYDGNGEVYADEWYPARSVDKIINNKIDIAKNELNDNVESIKNGIDEKLDKKLNKEVYYYGSHLIHEMDKKYFIIDEPAMILEGINIPEDEPFPTEIVIPCGIVGIMNDVFKDCVELESVVIPKSVSYIGTDAFSGCDNLVFVSFGGSKAEWEEIQILPGNDALINAHDLSYGDSSVSESFVLNLFSQAANPDDFYNKNEINDMYGDIDSVLDEIISLQVAKGGDSE